MGGRRLGLRSLPFSLLTFDFSRVPCIMEERVTTYAKWAADLSDLPPACGAEPEPLGTPEAVRERIAEIPTRLGPPLECDGQLLASAAAKLVAEHRGEIVEFLSRP